MHWTPSRPDPQLPAPPTRPARNRRERAPGEIEPVRRDDAGRFHCVPRVAFGDVVLDFGAHAIAVGPVRHLVPVRPFEIAAALLFAEGEEVTTAALAAICGTASARHANDVVGRHVGRLRRTVFADEGRAVPRGTGRGHRLVLTPGTHRPPRGDPR